MAAAIGHMVHLDIWTFQNGSEPTSGHPWEQSSKFWEGIEPYSRLLSGFAFSPASVIGELRGCVAERALHSSPKANNQGGALDPHPQLAVLLGPSP